VIFLLSASGPVVELWQLSAHCTACVLTIQVTCMTSVAAHIVDVAAQHPCIISLRFSEFSVEIGLVKTSF